jgi:hypothetical protein
MRMKLAVTTAAALLAGTILASAQSSSPQPGGTPPEDPPQGQDPGSRAHPGTVNPKAKGGNMNQGTTGQGQQDSSSVGATKQPGGEPPTAPPEGSGDRLPKR